MPSFISMVVAIAPPPPGPIGGVDALFALIQNNMSVTLPADATMFTQGSVLPTSDVGPFWYTGSNPPQWYGWDVSTGQYEPTVTIPNALFVGQTVFFQGQISDVTTTLNPLGWYLSDGGIYNGFQTISLIDQIVISAGNLYTTGATGGATTLASHTHTLPATTNGYTLQAADLPVSAYALSMALASWSAESIEAVYGNTGFDYPVVFTPSIAATTVGVSNAGGGGSHAHTITGPTGAVTGLSILPPYVALLPVVYCGT